jgi:type IV pilus biogenesis protein PilP
MVNKRAVQPFTSLVILTVSLLVYRPPLLGAEEGRIGDISTLQQKSLLLKVALEHAKLQRELNEMSEVKGVNNEICSQKGIGSLTLNAVYGVKKQRFATFSYNQATQVDAKAGDILLCGEKVSAISLDKVEVIKAGKRYTVAGSVTAVPFTPLKTVSPSLFQ